MKIAIAGYGKMGKVVEETALKRGHEIVDIIDPRVEGCSTWNEGGNRLGNADVAVCFTTPGTGYDVARECMRKGCDVVMASTEFCENPDGTFNHTKLDTLDDFAQSCEKGLVYASNFSPAVNALFRKIRDVSPDMARKGYAPFIVEVHGEKEEEVSRTAQTLGNLIRTGYEQEGKPLVGLFFDIKKAIKPVEFEESFLKLAGTVDDLWGDTQFTADVFEQVNEARVNGKLPIVAVRFGDVAGIHLVCFDKGISSYRHREVSHGRGDYAKGALDEAVWLQKQPPGVYNRNLLIGEVE